MIKVIQNKSAYKTVTDLSYDYTKHYIGRSTFRIGIGMHSNLTPNPTNIIFDRTIFKLNFYSQKLGWRNGVSFMNLTNLENGPCTEDDFPDVSSKVFDRANFVNYVCLK